MPIQDYLEAKKRVKKEIDTLQFRIRDAYDAAEGKLIGSDGLVDLAVLEDPTQRDVFRNEVISEFWDNAQEYFRMSDEDFGGLDDLRRDRLLFAYLGTSEAGVTKIIDGYKGELNFNRFMEEIQKQIESHLQELQQYPLTKLSQSDASGAVSYTGLEGTVDPLRLELRDIVGLIENFERFGAVPPKFLEGKPYLI